MATGFVLFMVKAEKFFTAKRAVSDDFAFGPHVVVNDFEPWR